MGAHRKACAILLALPHLHLYNVPVNYYYNSRDNDEAGCEVIGLGRSIYSIYKNKKQIFQSETKVIT